MSPRQGRPGRPGDEAVFNRLAVLRADRGLSRRELADALGIHYQTMGYLSVANSRPLFI